MLHYQAYWAQGRTTYSNRGLTGSFVVETNYLSATYPTVTPNEYSKQIIQVHYHKLQHPKTFMTGINCRMHMSSLPLNFERKFSIFHLIKHLMYLYENPSPQPELTKR